MYAVSGGRYGARRVYHQLCREQVQIDGSVVAWCTVERLLVAEGVCGCSCGCMVRITAPAVPQPGLLIWSNGSSPWPHRTGYGWWVSSAMRRCWTEWGWETFTGVLSQRRGEAGAV